MNDGEDAVNQQCSHLHQSVGKRVGKYANDLEIGTDEDVLTAVLTTEIPSYYNNNHRHFLEFFGIFWNFLEFFGIFWNFFGSPLAQLCSQGELSKRTFINR